MKFLVPLILLAGMLGGGSKPLPKVPQTNVDCDDPYKWCLEQSSFVPEDEDTISSRELPTLVTSSPDVGFLSWASTDANAEEPSVSGGGKWKVMLDEQGHDSCLTHNKLAGSHGCLYAESLEDGIQNIVVTWSKPVAYTSVVFLEYRKPKYRP